MKTKILLVLTAGTSLSQALSPEERSSIAALLNNQKNSTLNLQQKNQISSIATTGPRSLKNNINAILASPSFIDPKKEGDQIPPVPTQQHHEVSDIAYKGRPPRILGTSNNKDYINPFGDPPPIGGIAVRAARINKDFISSTYYNLFNPTPNHLLRELSPDRPDATESPLTVDAGRFALEASLFDYRRDRGAEIYTYGQLNFKAGLTKNTDFQTIVDLYSDTPDGYGFGDVTLRLKWNVYGNDVGDSALALMPFVKIPTDTELSNNQWEGGLIIPWGTTLTDTISLGLMAEFDYLFNEDTSDHELEFLHTAVLGFDLTDNTAAYLEYIGIAGEHDYQAYLAGGMNYAVNENLILDFGVQSGLNSAAEDFGLFTGFTKRF